MAPHTFPWKRQFYVHPIQRKYCFLALIPLIVCAFLLVFLVFVPLTLTLREASFEAEQAATLAQLYALGARVWPALLISMLVSSLLSFLVTNKFAGPLWRMERVMRRVAEGELPQAFRVRRADDLQEFAALLDGAFGTIASALSAIREQEARASQALAALRAKVSAELTDAREVLQGLEVIAQSQTEVDQILGQFRRQPQRGTEAPEPSP
jgi:methyl-accepting chemotaxis protein